jgi:hypothetical protein
VNTVGPNEQAETRDRLDDVLDNLLTGARRDMHSSVERVLDLDRGLNAILGPGTSSTAHHATTRPGARGARPDPRMDQWSPRPRRHLIRLTITVATSSAVAIGLLLGVAWFVNSPSEQRYEPAVSTLALLAGLIGIFAERWAAERERRNHAVASIATELWHNQKLLDDKAFQPTNLNRRRDHPRLMASALDAAFASGALSPRRDGELIEALHRWRATVNTVNQRLDVTEFLTLTATSTDQIERYNRALHRDDAYLRGIRDMLGELHSVVSSEHRMTRRSGYQLLGEARTAGSNLRKWRHD